MLYLATLYSTSFYKNSFGGCESKVIRIKTEICSSYEQLEELIKTTTKDYAVYDKSDSDLDEALISGKYIINKYTFYIIDKMVDGKCNIEYDLIRE